MTVDWNLPRRGKCHSAPKIRGPRTGCFAVLGSDAGGERAAIFYTLIRTAKLNGIDPEANLRDILTLIAEHPINKLGDLLPWNVIRPATPSVAA
jgi:IS66 C-terminal element